MISSPARWVNVELELLTTVIIKAMATSSLEKKLIMKEYEDKLVTMCSVLDRCKMNYMGNYGDATEVMAEGASGPKIGATSLPNSRVVLRNGDGPDR
ncbi:hypothetical protein EVAR_53905_1 [Eumeta japonica]|uniref:Uncharacterized protein n=1 Tax=Eumeta variegata TaxID=151549 RepID=A0A4C1YBL4_EUMVA|nr:hypothetical protein EVAR_53905_1 [Eumeta japonica]